HLNLELSTKKFYKKKSNNFVSKILGDYVEYEPECIKEIKEKIKYLNPYDDNSIIQTFDAVHLALVNEIKNKTSDHRESNNWIETKKTDAEKIKNGADISTNAAVVMPSPSAPLMTTTTNMFNSLAPPSSSNQINTEVGSFFSTDPYTTNIP